MAKSKKKLKTVIKTLLEEREILQRSSNQAHSLVCNIATELMEIRGEIREKDVVINRQTDELRELSAVVNNYKTLLLCADQQNSSV